MLVATAADVCVLVMVIVVAVLVGKPVSYLACAKYPTKGNTATFITSVYNNAVSHSKSNIFEFADPDRAACYEVKAVWGLSITLCILFSMSAITSACLWWRLKPVEAPKDIE